MITAFIAELGKEKTLKIGRDIIGFLARESDKALSAMAGGNSMAYFQGVLPLFSRGGALEMEILKTGSRTSAFTVTKCKYAEMHERLGVGEFGHLLSCGRDRAMIEGFDPGI